MAIDRKIFIESFIEELKENIDSINSGIIKLKNDIGNIDELNSILRAVHTIKGSSRMLKFSSIENISHGFESVLQGIKDERYGVDDNILRLVFKTTELLNKSIDLIKENQDDSDLSTETILNIYNKACSNEPFNLDTLEDNNSLEKEVEKNLVAFSDTSIRINVEKIDNIITSSNTLIISPLKLRKDIDLLELLEDKVKNINLSTKNKSYVVESLELIKEIKNNLKDELPQIERESQKIKNRLLKLRMLPINLILSPLNTMVQELSIKLGKEINLSVKGENILVDKLLLESLKDPIIHLVRNCIDHGIEKPDIRVLSGKQRAGSICIETTSNSGNISIIIKDDGQGIDYSSLRSSLRSQFPNESSKISSMTNSQLNMYLFKSGISTRSEISDISGRGVGLDIVQKNIEKIKGNISIETTNNMGTTFILKLPDSLGNIDGFFIEVKSNKFFIPATYVNKVITIKEINKHYILDKKIINVDNKLIPAYQISDLFHEEINSYADKHFALIVDVKGEELALIVDSVIEYSSIIYKSMPQSLKGVDAIQGVVFDHNFNIIPILSLSSIIVRLKSVCNIDIKRRFSSNNLDYKRILVVDDSITTRNIEKAILETENYSVDCAVDGIDGLEMAKKQYYSLIITDISMPRMDGYTFVENLRSNNTYTNTPIIVVSSINTDDSMKKFEDLKVDSFIIKSDFGRGNLLDEVNRLI